MRLPQTFGDVLRLAAVAGIGAPEARVMFAEIEEATLGAWEEIASEVDVSDRAKKIWGHEIQCQTAALRADFLTHRAKRPRRHIE
jgi:hypothetical protein